MLQNFPEQFQVCLQVYLLLYERILNLNDIDTDGKQHKELGERRVPSSSKICPNSINNSYKTYLLYNGEEMKCGKIWSTVRDYEKINKMMSSN